MRAGPVIVVLGVAGGVLAPGCSGDTGIELTVTSPLRAPEELQAVVVTVAAEGVAAGVILEERIDARGLPTTIAIAPRGGDSGRRVRIAAEPVLGTELRYRVPTSMVVESFVPGEVRQLTLRLATRCTLLDGAPLPEACGPPCLRDDDCGGGLCADTGCAPEACTAVNCVASDCEDAVCDSDRCVRTPRCGAGEECCDGACVAAGCDDGNPCTQDWCEAGGCRHDDDGRACM